MELSTVVAPPTPKPALRLRERSAFDVKVVEYELTDAAERWQELIRYLLEIDANQ